MIIESSNVGGFKTNSDVFVVDAYMYFQGTDQAVWRVAVGDSLTDRNNFGGPDRIKTKSNGFFSGGFMYFRGTDDKLWQMSVRPPYSPVNIGGFKTNSDVFVANGYRAPRTIAALWGEELTMTRQAWSRRVPGDWLRGF